MICYCLVLTDGFEQRKVDIANHAPTYALANAEFSDNKDGSMSMIASRDITSEEEVCVCYGEHNNEQLLFCYGFVIPENPCQGMLCPLPFPDTPARAELLHYTLADLRRRHGRNPSAKAGPTLRRPSKAEPGSSELLLALKIFDISEDPLNEVHKTCHNTYLSWWFDLSCIFTSDVMNYSVTVLWRSLQCFTDNMVPSRAGNRTLQTISTDSTN